MQKDYTISLDIGTNSVGYAVIVDKYDVASKKMRVYGDTDKQHIKKNLLGSVLFDEGQTAADRRSKRTLRRRYTRRRQRIMYLRQIFAPAINQVDSAFFHRLDESFLVPEDKTYQKYPIFATEQAEKAYHARFKTIYHLREYVANTDEQVDIRLVYLALAHILKYRGHFLIEGPLDTTHLDIDQLFADMLDVYNHLQATDYTAVSIKDILLQKLSRTKKVENILKLLAADVKNSLLHLLLKLVVGLEVDVKKVCQLDETMKLDMTSASYDDDLARLLGRIDESYAALFDSIHKLRNAYLLANTLSDSTHTTKSVFSSAMVAKYDRHHIELQQFKSFVRQYAPEKYADIFKNVEQDGYAGYMARSGKVTRTAFYKYLKKTLEEIPESEPILKLIDQDAFLLKQRTFDNGAVPHQIHLEEMKAILANQGRFYPFLLAEQGKIEKLLTFRIPYYVGPLAKQAEKFAWLTRQSDDKITPWNFENVVDLEASAIGFIQRMTGQDTYLPNEKVLPKNSLIYQQYMIFNELTKVTYNGMYFDSEMKQAIFEKFFKDRKRVSIKDLQHFLHNHYEISDATIKGLDKETGYFNATYSTYHDLKRIKGMETLLDDDSYQAVLEEIIKELTLFEGRKMLKKRLSQYQHILSEQQMNELASKKYTGWGRLSEKLLIGIRDKETHKTILDYLKNDDGVKKHYNRNLQQLITDDGLSFKAYIAQAQQIDTSKDIKDIVYSLAGSPAIKKGILTSLKVVDELVAIMGYQPKNIVIEMARETQKTNRTKGRLEKVKKGLKALGGKEYTDKELKEFNLADDKLYLYLLQGCKDMYTGEDIDFNFIHQYDIDHIIPQAYLKDDSLDNIVLTRENRKKADNVPDINIVKKCKPYWQRLLKAGLISETKFDRLIKAEYGGITAEDRVHFIKRQLVETRQITKHVARILHEQFNTADETTVNIVPLKAEFVSRFRRQHQLDKVREVNDYHHAHDAYLNGVIATALLNVYPQARAEFVYGQASYFKFGVDENNKEVATARREWYQNVTKFLLKNGQKADENGEVMWDTPQALHVIKRILNKAQVNVVKRTAKQKGAFTKETVNPKSTGKRVSVKQHLDPQKYGGYIEPTVAYTLAVVYQEKKEVRTFVPVYIMDRQQFEKDPLAFLAQAGYTHVKSYKILPKYSLFLFKDGTKRLLASSSELQKGNQFVLDSRYLRLLSENYDKETDEGRMQTLKGQFAELLAVIKQFNEQYIHNKDWAKIEDAFQRHQAADLKTMAHAFRQLLAVTKMGPASAFTFFDVKIDRTRYMKVKDCWQATLIQQSITGLYETRIDMEKL